MPKVTTMQDSVQITETIKSVDQRPKRDLNAVLASTDAPVPTKTVEMPPPPLPDATADTLPVEDEIEHEDKDLPERAAKRIAKKHREMKEAQEAAAESDRLAEDQYNRAIMAERRAADLEAKLAESTKTAPVAPVEAKAPAEADFFKDVNGQRIFQADDYIKAVTKYAAEEAVKADRAERAKEDIARAEAVNRAQVQAKIDAFKEGTPDWDSVISSSKSSLPTPVLDYIVASDAGARLYYHYAKNEADAQKVMDTFNAELAKNPGESGLRRAAMKAVAMIARLEASLEKPAEAQAAPKTVETKGAPAPITPIPTGGTTVIQTDPSKMNFKELRAYHRQQEMVKSRR